MSLAPCRAAGRSIHDLAAGRGLRGFSRSTSRRQNGAVGSDAFLLYWTKVITGLEPERIRSARDEIATWPADHPARALLAESVDAAVAATLLVEGIGKLVAHGVPVERLRRKLRVDREVWGTWAEIRAADLVLRAMRGDVELRLEEGRERGAHADLRFVHAEALGASSIEVKAVGLSDDEVKFCRRMAPSLGRMLPPQGLAHLHSPIHGLPPKLTREERRAMGRHARQAARKFPNYPTGLRGATIVGHGSEASYLRRVSARVAQAVRQLPSNDDCWVAIFWSNGAPLEAVHSAVSWSEIPEHVLGIVLVGCGVIFGHPQIHCFTSRLHRDARPTNELTVCSADPSQHQVASLVLDTFESPLECGRRCCGWATGLCCDGPGISASCRTTC